MGDCLAVVNLAEVSRMDYNCDVTELTINPRIRRTFSFFFLLPSFFRFVSFLFFEGRRKEEGRGILILGSFFFFFFFLLLFVLFVFWK